MALVILLAGTEPARVAREFAARAPSLKVRTFVNSGEGGDKSIKTADVRYALAWKPQPGVLKRFPKLEAIFSYGAGVDHLLSDPELPAHVPIVRLVDPDLTQRMSEYVALHTLLHHRRMTEYFGQQSRALWHELEAAAAGDVRVGVMGLGVLGTSAAKTLTGLGYRVAGWSRTPKTIDGIETFSGPDGGNDGLDRFLARTDILAVLLPLTPATRGIINGALIDRLSRDGGRNGALPGPVLINAGRGGLQVEADILDRLNSGRLHAASLDVFETEPLPATSPLWRHPRVIITPHNASTSSPAAVAGHVLAQIARLERGERMQHVVERGRGY